VQSWAIAIEQMPPAARAKAAFGPYLVTPEGSLRLPLEMLRVDGPSHWPVAEAPGWKTLALPDGSDHTQWLPLGSEYFFRGEQPLAAHAPSNHRLANIRVDGGDALRLVLRGEAFPFCSRFFALPQPDEFIMNSFEYHVPEMDTLGVFIGYRGHSQRFPEVLTPGLFRAHQEPSKQKHVEWLSRSRVASNVLKQRFLEHENKPLTDLEARGILQHHYVIGPTDMVDLSFDLNVAKWFSLNRFANGGYQQKVFREKTDARKAAEEASCVYGVAVRAIGSVPLDGEAAQFLTPGVTLNWWEGLGFLSSEPPKPKVPPYNLAPLWSEFPRRQKGFGLRGIYPGELDKFGAVLVVTEHPFHPTFFRNGWDRIGGPEFTIDGKRFALDDDSSSMAEYLFPERPDWFEATAAEAKGVVEQVA
jgi:FRG domain